MAEEAGIMIPNPIGISPKYDYNSFIIDTAKDLFSFKFFDLQDTKTSEAEVVKIAEDSLFRAKILANVFVEAGLLET